jgi:hypothetical protein
MANNNLTNANFANIAVIDANGLVTGITTGNVTATSNVTGTNGNFTTFTATNLNGTTVTATTGNITTVNATTVNATTTNTTTLTATGVSTLGKMSAANVTAMTITGPVSSNSTVSLSGATTSLGPYSEKVNALGSVTGTTAINYTLGTVVTMTLNGNITINSNNITNFPAAGSSMTWVLTQGGTGGYTITSNLYYAGGSKTLSTSGGAIDVINVIYDGNYYLASLVKGYI